MFVIVPMLITTVLTIALMSIKPLRKELEKWIEH